MTEILFTVILILLHSERPKCIQFHLSECNIVDPIALKKAKIVCNFGLSECNRVKPQITHSLTACLPLTFITVSLLILY